MRIIILVVSALATVSCQWPVSFDDRALNVPDPSGLQSDCRLESETYAQASKADALWARTDQAQTAEPESDNDVTAEPEPVRDPIDLEADALVTAVDAPRIGPGCANLPHGEYFSGRGSEPRWTVHSDPLLDFQCFDAATSSGEVCGSYCRIPLDDPAIVEAFVSGLEERLGPPTSAYPDGMTGDWMWREAADRLWVRAIFERPPRPQPAYPIGVPMAVPPEQLPYHGPLLIVMTTRGPGANIRGVPDLTNQRADFWPQVR